MAQYTGANFKQRALIALRENPLDPARTHIFLVPSMGEFEFYFSCKNVPYRDDGILPISDLAEIETAVRENIVLQRAYAQAQGRDAERNGRQSALYNAKVIERNQRIERAGNPDDATLRALDQALDAEFAPHFESLKREAKEDYARAAPWMLTMTPSTYCGTIGVRATQISGITVLAESQQNIPDDEWQSKWQSFIEKGGYTADQQRMLRAFRHQSTSKVLIDPPLLRGQLSRIGNAFLIFNAEELKVAVAFSNQMAHKCAPFIAQATVPDLTCDVMDSESPAPS